MTAKELILTHILKCKRSDLYINPQELTSDQQKLYEEITRRVEAGDPLQYVLGECEFFEHSLSVDQRVLIPRPETELLVEIVVDSLHNAGEKKTQLLGLDIGVGSGNITISLLKAIPNLSMTAIDVSMPALEVCRENIRRNDVGDRADLLHADVFEWLKLDHSQTQKFSFVVSNPPYIKRGDLKSLPDNVKREPVIALDGGVDGLVFYRLIISRLGRVLKPGGWIFFEIGEDQGKSLDNLLTSQGSFVNITIIKDYNQKDRFVKAQLIL